MNDPEKLTALKKAYADTILNTAKEAAARVVLSEKKARGCQQELVAVRDEALRTLLRLKQMFDSKVKEAKIISLRQQSKIEELEAQLEEAEDIVGELRMELRELQNVLEKEMSDQTHVKNKENLCREYSDADRLKLNRDNSSCERSEAVGSRVSHRQSGVVMANGIKNPSLNAMKNIHRCSYKDNGDGSHYSLPSILTRRREGEVLKEECNPVIHSLQWSMAYEDMSATVELDGVKDNGPSSKCKTSSYQNLVTSSDCSNVSDSPSLDYSNIRDGEETQLLQNGPCYNGSDTPMSLKTLLSTQESDRKSLIGEPESGKEEKVYHENNKVSTSLLCEGSLASPSDRRFIKYTFKRKRKKDALCSPDGDSSLEESGNNKSQKTGEKDNSYLESLKSSLIAESSRDSRRVAQVARQLVPLSENKGLVQKQYDDSLAHK